jgi:hypothetical protein
MTVEKHLQEDLVIITPRVFEDSRVLFGLQPS